MILRLLLSVMFLSSIFQEKEIPYDEITLGCVNISGLPREGIIRSQDEYMNIFKPMSHLATCAGYLPPPVDFKKKIVLFVAINAGGCSEPNIVTRLFERNDTIQFQITVKEFGICRSGHQKLHAILIDSPSGKSIKFSINKIR